MTSFCYDHWLNLTTSQVWLFWNLTTWWKSLSPWTEQIWPLGEFDQWSNLISLRFDQFETWPAVKFNHWSSLTSVGFDHLVKIAKYRNWADFDHLGVWPVVKFNQFRIWPDWDLTWNLNFEIWLKFEIWNLTSKIWNLSTGQIWPLKFEIWNLTSGQIWALVKYDQSQIWPLSESLSTWSERIWPLGSLTSGQIWLIWNLTSSKFERLDPSFSKPSPKRCCDDFSESYGWLYPGKGVWGLAADLTSFGVAIDRQGVTNLIFRNFERSKLTSLARRVFFSSKARTKSDFLGAKTASHPKWRIAPFREKKDFDQIFFGPKLTSVAGRIFYSRGARRSERV